ncbi:MAG TPA: IclR family transcriptional regulator [Ktedonobacteraceae bacterium]|nr:IclR family transcriptional regulator [Ktedonobacteraceae bacterium]
MPSSGVADTKVGVLDKAVAILHVFLDGDVALTPLEIAQRTQLPVPTVYRLAQALHEHGLLKKDGQRFGLGMTLLRLGSMVAENNDVRTQALPHLKWLREQTGENAELHIRHDETRLAVEIIRAAHNLRPFVEVGAPLPLHQGAGGKVLLAWLPPAERSRLAIASTVRFRGRPFDVSKLLAELEHIRDVGWAMSEGERASGVSALAAPVFDFSGQVVGALILAAPTVRLGEAERATYIPLVCEAARRTSHDLGFVAEKD